MSRLNLDALLDQLAGCVAEKLRGEVASASTGGGVRPRLLTVEQAAVYLSRSQHSVRHLIKTKRLPVVRLDDRVFLDLKDLDRAIEAAKEVAL